LWANAIPAGGRDGCDSEVMVDYRLDAFGFLLSYDQDDANGVVVVMFHGALGGEQADLSEPSDGPWTIIGGEWPSLRNTLDAAGRPWLVFPNVAPGTVQVQVAGGPSTDCAVEATSIVDWPVEVGVATYIDVQCAQ